jgi:hypothetical protein
MKELIWKQVHTFLPTNLKNLIDSYTNNLVKIGSRWNKKLSLSIDSQGTESVLALKIFPKQ